MKAPTEPRGYKRHYQALSVERRSLHSVGEIEALAPITHRFALYRRADRLAGVGPQNCTSEAIQHGINVAMERCLRLGALRRVRAERRTRRG